jgi:Flp pilus assembly protein TadD
LNDPEALSYAEKANRLAPDQPKILDTLGVLLAERGNTERAVQSLQRAVQLAPADPALRLNLARVLLQAGDRNDARRELEELAKLGNRFPKQAEVGALMKTL